MTTIPKALAALALLAAPLAAQDFPTGDPLIKQIYDEGMQRSQAWHFGQVLMDSIGPRLTGSPGARSANDWIVKTYAAMGISAKNEQWGTWRDWTRGLSRAELITPRLKNLEGIVIPYSPGLSPSGVIAEAVMLPPASETKDSAGFVAWAKSMKGKIVLTSFPQTSCRPDSAWIFWSGDRGSYTAMRAQRDSASREFTSRTAPLGRSARTILPQILEQAGAVALIGSSWSGGWGTNKMQSISRTSTIPQFDLSCEDYGLVARLAANNMHPTVRLFADIKT
jgi:hypothetical protein